MKLTLPDELDDTLRGMSVTFWSDAKHKWLIQWSPDQARPCFARIEGIQRKITVAFDAAELYRKLVACLVSNELPESPLTEWPSLDIGIAYVTLKVYSNVRATEEGLKSFGTRELAEYLQEVVAAAPELAS